jgi:hypothetical protein
MNTNIDIIMHFRKSTRKKIHKPTECSTAKSWHAVFTFPGKDKLITTPNSEPPTNVEDDPSRLPRLTNYVSPAMIYILEKMKICRNQKGK